MTRPSRPSISNGGAARCTTARGGGDSALRAQAGAALLVVNALRWTMTGDGTPQRYRERAGTEDASPSRAAREALTAHLASGGVLGMHTAALCFDDWTGWADTLGGAWEWGRSHHPPVGPEIGVRIAARHPLVEGLDDFSLFDEVYGDLRTRPDVEGLLDAVQPGTDGPALPLLWAREHGGGHLHLDARLGQQAGETRRGGRDKQWPWSGRKPEDRSQER